MKKGSLAIFFVLSTFSAFSQSEKRYIEVLGSAESDVTPDIIILSFTLKEYDEDKARVTIDKLDKDFLIAVGKSAILKSNISISDFSAASVTKRRREREVYTRKVYEILFSKTTDVLEFLENLKNVKLEMLNVVKLSHTQIEKYRLDLKVNALKAAERKADALLAAVDAKRGKPLIILENQPQTDVFAIRSLSTSNTYYTKDKGSESQADGEIPFKNINLRFEIVARFEIE